MRRILLLSVFRPVLRTAVVVSLLSPAAYGQFGSTMLNPLRTRLQVLGACLGPDFAPLRDLQMGLMGRGSGGGYGGGGGYGASAPEPIPPPPAYMDSLDRDIQACRAAGGLGGDSKQALLDGVRQDIEIKAKDCRKFGMGRTISVRVVTMRGSQKDDGWEVYYKWNCSSAFQPAEMRAPQLTSPAVIQVPPGNYTFRAQKRMQDNQMVNTPPTTVVVGLQKAADIQIPIQ